MRTTVSFEVDEILDGIDKSELEDYVAAHINEFCLGNLLEKVESTVLEEFLERKGYNFQIDEKALKKSFKGCIQKAATTIKKAIKDMEEKDVRFTYSQTRNLVSKLEEIINRCQD